MQHATCDMRHATCNMQHAACNMRHATCNMHHATCTMQRARQPHASRVPVRPDAPVGRARAHAQEARPLRGTPLVRSGTHSACRMSHVACRMSHVACCMSHVACRMLHVACCGVPRHVAPYCQRGRCDKTTMGIMTSIIGIMVFIFLQKRKSNMHCMVLTIRGPGHKP